MSSSNYKYLSFIFRKKTLPLYRYLYLRIIELNILVLFSIKFCMAKIIKHRVIDIFSGCGGLSLGLHNAGWQGIFAIEKNPQAFRTLKYNLIDRRNHFRWPKWLPMASHDINEVIDNYSEELKKLKGRVTLIAGGPPCQGFSMAGQRNEEDDRNQLIHAYIKFVSLIMPKLIFFENVKGFTMKFKDNKQKGYAYSELVLKQLDELGYHVCGKLVNFGDYGVPQKRTRFILIGMRKTAKGASKKKVESFFEKLEDNKFSFLGNKGLVVNPTIQDAMSDLVTTKLFPTPDRKGFSSSEYCEAASGYQKYVRKNYNESIPHSHSFAKHTDKVKHRLEYILSISTKCKNLSDELKHKLGIKKQVLVPLMANEQAPTITSHPDDLIHYCEPRILTVREYARLQSFPDDFEFQGKYTTGGKLRKVEVPRYTQIGNAIPPLFGEQSGIILNEMIR